LEKWLWIASRLPAGPGARHADEAEDDVVDVGVDDDDAVADDDDDAVVAGPED
jgi:hypothetical protein